MSTGMTGQHQQGGQQGGQGGSDLVCQMAAVLYAYVSRGGGGDAGDITRAVKTAMSIKEEVGKQEAEQAKQKAAQQQGDSQHSSQAPQPGASSRPGR